MPEAPRVSACAAGEKHLLPEVIDEIRLRTGAAGPGRHIAEIVTEAVHTTRRQIAPRYLTGLAGHCHGRRFISQVS